MLKRITALMLAVLMLTCSLPVFAGTPSVSARTWLLYEMKTKKVLAENRSGQAVPIASLTKLMTCLLTLEAVRDGRIGLDSVVTVPAGFANPGGSTMGLRAGMQLTVRQLLQGLLVVSGNDCAVVLARTVGGSEAQFVKRMNQRAKQLGMLRTYYLNPTGLPTPGGENRASAADLGILARILMENHSAVLLPITRARSLESLGAPAAGNNTNGVLNKLGLVDGLKTGHTDAAGYCLVATMPYPGADDHRLVAIVLGTADEYARDTAAIQLLEWSVENWEVRTFASVTDTITLGDWGGLEGRTVQAYPEKDWREWVPKDSYRVETVQKMPSRLPLKQGDVVGELRVTFGDGSVRSVNLLSKTDILDLSAYEQMQVLMGGIAQWWVPQSTVLTSAGIMRYSFPIY